MKHLSKFMIGALALGFWSCSSDEPGIDNTQDSDGNVFASLTVALPVRSTTEDTPSGSDYPSASDNGFEIGQPDENNVNDIYVVLASKQDGTVVDYNYITSSLTSAVLDQSSSRPVYSVRFTSEDLEQQGGKEVYVFAYCNPTSALKTAIEGLAVGASINDLQGAITNGDNLDIASGNHFLMTNALLTSTTLPDLETMLKENNTEATALNLGTVSVERVVSRFDFQNYEKDGELNTYLIKDNASGLTAAKIELNGIALFNEAKDYYYLPRMSATGVNKEIRLCGYELPSNPTPLPADGAAWVVSPNAEAKVNFAVSDPKDYSLVSDKYFFNLNTLPKDYNYTLLSSLSKPDRDDWTDAAGTSYNIWRYSTENTLPGINTFLHGITTGVVFRGEIKPYTPVSEGADAVTGTHPATTLSAAMAKGENLYAFSDTENGETTQVTVMLGSAMDAWKYSKTHVTSLIRTNFVKAVKAGYFKLYSDENAATQIEVTETTSEETIFGDNVKAVKGQDENNAVNGYVNNNGFVVYTPTGDQTAGYHYYVYYYYYNRHNNNNESTSGAMEFGAVRNNIYKLNVENVMQFGLPGDVPPPPHEEDEPKNVFFQVRVKVLDWVVRVNSIIL